MASAVIQAQGQGGVSPALLKRAAQLVDLKATAEQRAAALTELMVEAGDADFRKELTGYLLRERDRAEQVTLAGPVVSRAAARAVSEICDAHLDRMVVEFAGRLGGTLWRLFRESPEPGVQLGALRVLPRCNEGLEATPKDLLFLASALGETWSRAAARSVGASVAKSSLLPQWVEALSDGFVMVELHEDGDWRKELMSSLPLVLPRDKACFTTAGKPLQRALLDQRFVMTAGAEPTVIASLVQCLRDGDVRSQAVSALRAIAGINAKQKAQAIQALAEERAIAVAFGDATETTKIDAELAAFATHWGPNATAGAFVLPGKARHRDGLLQTLTTHGMPKGIAARPLLAALLAEVEDGESTGAARQLAVALAGETRVAASDTRAQWRASGRAMVRNWCIEAANPAHILEKLSAVPSSQRPALFPEGISGSLAQALEQESDPVVRNLLVIGLSKLLQGREKPVSPRLVRALIDAKEDKGARVHALGLLQGTQLENAPLSLRQRVAIAVLPEIGPGRDPAPPDWDAIRRTVEEELERAARDPAKVLQSGVLDKYGRLALLWSLNTLQRTAIDIDFVQLGADLSLGDQSFQFLTGDESNVALVDGLARARPLRPIQNLPEADLRGQVLNSLLTPAMLTQIVLRHPAGLARDFALRVLSRLRDLGNEVRAEPRVVPQLVRIELGDPSSQPASLAMVALSRFTDSLLYSEVEAEVARQRPSLLEESVERDQQRDPIFQIRANLITTLGYVLAQAQSPMVHRTVVNLLAERERQYRHSADAPEPIPVVLTADAIRNLGKTSREPGGLARLGFAANQVRAVSDEAAHVLMELLISRHALAVALGDGQTATQLVDTLKRLSAREPALRAALESVAQKTIDPRFRALATTLGA